MMSQSTELSRLLSEARLEGYRENLENDLKVSSVAQLRQLRNYSELAQIGMKKEEIERLRRLLKGNTMSKLRKLKALHGRSLDSDVPSGSRKDPRFALDTGTVNRENNVWSCELRQSGRSEMGTLSKSSRSEFNPHAVKDLRPRVTGSRRLVQRSISASVDCDRSVTCDRFARSSSLVRNAGREVGVGSNGFLKLRHRKDYTERYSVDNILSVLSGPPYTVETTTSDDTSPLIQSDVEPFVRARHSFDNLASFESTLEVVGYPSSVVTSNDDLNNGQDENREVVETVRGKRKKPSLKISIPEPDNGVRCNLKPMSALAERQINEAIELASTLARLSTEERAKLAPRTPSSFSDGCSSPLGNFFFSLRKNRSSKDEKKSFIDGVNSTAVDPNRVMTPGALEAYDVLVMRTPGGETRVDEAKDDDESNRRSWESSSGESASSGESQLPLPPSHLALNGTQNGRLRKEEVSRKTDELHFTTRSSPPLDVTNGLNGCALHRSSSLDLSDEEKHRTKPNVSSISHPNNNLEDMDELSPPAYPAPSPPSAPVALKLENSNVDLKLEVTAKEPENGLNGSPPPLPEKKSRKDSVGNLPGSDSPPWYRAPSPPPTVPPPALPPRIRLRQSTINCKPNQRRFPLASETLPRSHHEATTQPNAFVVSCGSHHHQHPKTLPRQTSEVNHSGNSDRRKSRPNRPSHSVESRSSCESDLGNLTHESEDSVFSDSAAPSQAKPQISGRSASLAGVGSGRPIKLNIRNVKLNAAELGIYDKADLFWVKSVNFDLPEKSQSESDLLQDVSAPIPGRYETSDCVSYEDLMEFALDGPVRTSRSGVSREFNSNSLMCEEVRILMKMFPNDVTVEDCMDALAETFWDVHSAVKLIKLKQVMSTGLADKQQCKQALLFCHWNVNEAALYLLTPPQQRITPDLVNV